MLNLKRKAYQRRYQTLQPYPPNKTIQLLQSSSSPPNCCPCNLLIPTFTGLYKRRICAPSMRLSTHASLPFRKTHSLHLNLVTLLERILLAPKICTLRGSCWSLLTLVWLSPPFDTARWNRKRILQLSSQDRPSSRALAELRINPMCRSRYGSQVSCMPRLFLEEHLSHHSGLRTQGPYRCQYRILRDSIKTRKESRIQNDLSDRFRYISIYSPVKLSAPKPSIDNRPRASRPPHTSCLKPSLAAHLHLPPFGNPPKSI